MDSASGQRRGRLIAFSLGSFAICVWLGALGWGSWSGLLSHPARAAAFALGFVMMLAALASPINLSSGTREDL